MSAKEMTDKELMDRLKHEGAMWFNNTNLLLLEELFRRYVDVRKRAAVQGRAVQSPGSKSRRESFDDGVCDSTPGD